MLLADPPFEVDAAFHSPTLGSRSISVFLATLDSYVVSLHAQRPRVRDSISLRSRKDMSSLTLGIRDAGWRCHYLADGQKRQEILAPLEKK
jgi:hypothetical protein